MNQNLDATDKKMLSILQRNARISISELSQQVNLSNSPCARRLKALEDSGLIQEYTTVLNPKALGLNLSVFIAVTMDKHTPERFEAFEAAIEGFEEVVSCSVVTGRSEDYLIRAVVKDMQHYEHFLLGKLTKIEGVQNVHTSFELRSVIQRTHLPLH